MLLRKNILRLGLRHLLKPSCFPASAACFIIFQSFLMLVHDLHTQVFKWHEKRSINEICLLILTVERYVNLEKMLEKIEQTHMQRRRTEPR